jgi:hypothetical protein
MIIKKQFEQKMDIKILIFVFCINLVNVIKIN